MSQHPVSLLILNGKNTDNDALRSAVQQSREAGFTLHVRVTWEHGDAKRYVEEAAQLKVNNVIAAGDGTINEVASALVQCAPAQRPALGIIPLGTANDFATSCQIPLDIEHTLQLALKGHATPIDVACVNDSH